MNDYEATENEASQEMKQYQHTDRGLLDCDLFSLKMEDARSSEKLVFYQITSRCHNPENHDMNLHY
jgi:hypothetical protein